MKETDDGKSLDGSDGGAVPPTSTNTLIGKNVHGMASMPGYYYSQREWDRAVGYGKVPPERDKQNMGVNKDRRTDESLQEDSDT